MAAASTGKLRRGEATMDKRLYRRGIERGNVAVWVWGVEEGRYSVAERQEMAMSGRFETIGRGNVVVRGGSRGGMLLRSRTPRNGDEWQI